MYSSCPNIIKHFVPIKFSFASIDNKNDSPIQPNVPQNTSMPLTNMKLQCLKQKPKDYILIFKNKTYKEYSPRKQIKYSPLIKEMKKINHQALEDVNILERKTEGISWTRNVVSVGGQRWKNRVEGCQSVDRARGLHIQWRNNKTASSTKRMHLSTKHSSTRQQKKPYRYSKQNEEQSVKQKRPMVQSARKQNQQVKSLINFKLKGSKAPKSETVDFFKKLNLDINFNLADKLFK